MGMAEGVQLGDMLHKNFNQTFSIGIAGAGARKDRELQRDVLGFNREKFDFEKLLGMQDLQEKQRKTDWIRRFQLAMSGGA